MDTLTIDDLSQVRSEYYQYEEYWFTIGLQLGMEYSQLRNIQSDIRYHNQSDYFREMLAKWLNNDTLATQSRLKVAIQVVDRENKKKEKEVNAVDRKQRRKAKLSSYFIKAAMMAIVLGLIIPIILLVCVTQVSYTQSHGVQLNAPTHSAIQAAAETLRKNYMTLPITELNLPQSEGRNLHVDYLDVVLKDMSGKTFMHNELLSNYTGESGRLIITGQPGSGKSTLLRHLAMEWAESRTLQSCQILFLIELGELDGKISSLNDLLTNSGYEDLKGVKQIAEEIYGNEGAGACFLLDAYDLLKHNYKFIDDIMQGSRFHSSFCVLTLRSIVNKFNKNTHFEMVGYKLDSLADHIRRYTDDANVINSINTLWENDKNVKEMCTSPLHLIMILYTYEYGNVETIQTKTQTYIAFMNVTIRHYLEGGLKDWNTESLWKCIRYGYSSMHDNFCTAFKELHHVAYDMYFKKQVSFPDDSAVVRNIDKLSFVEIHHLPGTASAVKYKFSHPTFLEFLAALYITCRPLNEQFATISVIRGVKDSQVGTFYTGFIGELYKRNISAATPYLKQLFKTSVVSNALTEAYSEYRVFDVCSAVIDVSNARLQELGWTASTYTTAIAMEFVVNSTLCMYLQRQVYETNSLYEQNINELILGNWKTHLLVEHSSEISTFTLEKKDRVLTSQDTFLQSIFCSQVYVNSCPQVMNSLITSLSLALYSWMESDPPTFEEIKRFHNLRSIKVSLLLVNRAISITQQKAVSSLEVFGSLQNLSPDLWLHLNIDRCCLEDIGILFLYADINHINHLTVIGNCTDNVLNTMVNCKQTELKRLSVFIYRNSHIESLTKCLNQTKGLLELDIVFSNSVSPSGEAENLFCSLPSTLRTLHILGRNPFVELRNLTDRLRSMQHLSSLWIVSNSLSSADVKLLVDNLKSNSDLRTLTLTISNEDESDVQPLNQLTQLKHLHLCFGEIGPPTVYSYPHAEFVFYIKPIAMDVTTALTRISYLHDLTKLQTFSLNFILCEEWNKHDQIRLVNALPYYTKVGCEFVDLNWNRYLEPQVLFVL